MPDQTASIFLYQRQLLRGAAYELSQQQQLIEWWHRQSTYQCMCVCVHVHI